MKWSTDRVVWGWVATGAIVVAALGAPTASQAQDPEWGIHRAEKMEAEARSLADERDRWDHAAWLFEQAATLRPAGDLEAVIDLHWAGRLAYYTGDVRMSVRTLEAAGKRAMQGGDVFTAGNLFVDAAWVASKSGKESKALDFILTAQRVVAAPVLSDDVRGTVLDRIDQASGAVMVAADFAGDLEDFGPGL